MEVDLAVTGAGGQLGRSLVEQAADRGRVVGLGHDELPVEDGSAVRLTLAALRPRWVLHCAAWTDVDGCESDPERAEAVNAIGTRHVADACREIGAAMIYVSTDFVFDGDARSPYPVDAEPRPLSVYGSTKQRGEREIAGAALDRWYIVRTSWVFGPGGRNFPRAILDRARDGEPLRVVDDQVGSPTYAPDLAEALLDLAESGTPSGIFHAANAGHCSWHRFACDILECAGLGDVEVTPVPSSEFPRPATRPAYSVLDCSRLTSVRGRALPNYQDAIQRFLSREP